jgi:toxin FitB
MTRIILDTDVSSLSLKRKLPSELSSRLVGTQVGITFVTLGELTKWAVFRGWGIHRQDKLARWLMGKPVLPYSDEIAHKWGELSAYADRRGRPRPHNDTWVAACCLVYGVPLATLNVKDFRDFVEHEGLLLVTG